ncbi:LysR family transcriptional regulator [Pseudobacillus wudalianchiensis]|uniref:LysR family transcriptional regulator n=1 Tax=Pseudobacillus wudalianchiensis TaxID=1743143 RepID=A0A1B9AE99_9BACI|nr:LysR family transcriptional regulator [Bacillus wudalianchiensis]OCA82154.1 LysR family transcriptional regulator [Bacillus wudalianchiensis]
MSLKKYITYIKVVETGSLTKAAEILNYTQPSISQMISSLEEEYGFSLLVRQKNGVKPTENGLKVLKAMREIEKGYGKLSETVDEINGLETGNIRIGAYISIATNWMPKILSEFKQLYPFIEIQLYEGNASELERWLDEDKIDFAIGSSYHNKGYFRFLSEDPIVAVMNSQHELAQSDVIDIRTLESVEYILPYSDSLFEVHDLIKKAGIQPRVAYRIRGDETIIAMVRNNLGISLLPQLLLSHSPLDNITVKPLSSYTSRKVGILTNTTKHAQTPSIHKMIHFIEEWVEKHHHQERFN